MAKKDHKTHGLFLINIIFQEEQPLGRSGRLWDTFGKIYFQFTSLTEVFFVKLVGKYLRLLAAVWTLAGKGFKVFKEFKARAMQWCAHNTPLFFSVADSSRREKNVPSGLIHDLYEYIY
ncbi:MAG: hypothetical protein HY742_06935 [Deltaproteobacteria bacterium]|nr:hypothetical protein [Deltaproteobacteria bacterium]